MQVVLNIKCLSEQLCMQKIRLLLSLMSGLISSFQHGIPLSGKYVQHKETSPGSTVTGDTYIYIYFLEQAIHEYSY